jgi:hypothetical protein
MPVAEIGRYDRVWKPHAKQVEFIEIPWSFFEALYGGAVGGGKSELLYMLPIIYGFHEQPGFHGVMFRETFPQLESSLILRSLPIYKALGASYDASKHIATFPSGAKIKFSYVGNIRDAYEHDTIEYQYMGFDELTHFERDVYMYLTSRVRSLVSGVPPIIRSATNPGNIGHLWVRKHFIEPAPAGGKRIYDRESESSRIFIRALLTDNPYLMEKDPGYIKRLKLLSTADYRAKVLGDWWVFAGQVFTEWRDPHYGAKFPDEPANACHVISNISPPAYLPRIVACDWGYHPGRTWVGWGVVTPDKRAILYRERVWERTNISVWGADVARISQPERDSIVSCKLDPSAWGHRGEEKTLAEQIIEATGLPFEKADNDRLGGKALMHEFLRWSPRPVSFIPASGYDEDQAFKILRNHGPDAYKEYTNLFREEEVETNLPRLQVCESCEEFRKIIPACVYAEKEGKRAEDVAEFVGDDAYDGGRYFIKAIDDYINNLSLSEATKHSELAKIVQDFEQTSDWNTYNRRMAAYDKEFRQRTDSVAKRNGRFSASRLSARHATRQGGRFRFRPS